MKSWERTYSSPSDHPRRRQVSWFLDQSTNGECQSHSAAALALRLYSCSFFSFELMIYPGGKESGTGLGLYSLMKRMEALKGSCGTNRRSDGLEGAEVWFCFPYRPDAIAESYDNNCNDPSITKDLSRCNSDDQSISNSISDDTNLNLTKGEYLELSSLCKSKYFLLHLMFFNTIWLISLTDIRSILELSTKFCSLMSVWLTRRSRFFASAILVILV